MICFKQRTEIHILYIKVIEMRSFDDLNRTEKRFASEITGT